MRRIGVLMPLAADDAESQPRLGAFFQGMQQLGWTDGRNMQMDLFAFIVTSGLLTGYQGTGVGNR